MRTHTGEKGVNVDAAPCRYPLVVVRAETARRHVLHSGQYESMTARSALEGPGGRVGSRGQHEAVVKFLMVMR